MTSGDRHPQDAIDAAVAGETVTLDPAVEHTLREPLTITRPDVTLRGPTLRLADGADENLIEIGADGVHVTGFTLEGNREHQPGERQSSGVLVTGASGVAITNGRVRNVSRHGLRVVDASDPTSLAPGDTIHVDRGPVSDVTVRDVRVDAPRRDGCSLEGPDLENVSVRNVRTFGSSDRGCIEVKDGATDAAVTGCHAEDCVYGIAVQDHGEHPTANVRIAGNTARDCETLVDAQTTHRPEDIAVVGNTGRDLGGDGMGGPGGIYLHLVDGLVVADNTVDDVDGPGIRLDDCSGVVASGNVVRNVTGPGIESVGCVRTTFDGNGIERSGGAALSCRGGEGAAEVLVSGNRCDGTLAMEGGLDRYLVTGNLLTGSIDDEADGSGRVIGNLARDPSRPQ